MIRTLLLGLAMVAAADGASAQGRTVYGFSSTSCGQWLQAPSAKKRSSLQLQAYVDGFLSEYNFAADDPDFLASMPHDKGALKDELLARAR